MPPRRGAGRRCSRLARGRRATASTSPSRLHGVHSLMTFFTLMALARRALCPVTGRALLRSRRGARGAEPDAGAHRLLPAGDLRLEQHRAPRGDGGRRGPRLLPGGLLLRHLCRDRRAPAAAFRRHAGRGNALAARLDDRGHRACHLGRLQVARGGARLCALCRQRRRRSSPSPGTTASRPASRSGATPPSTSRFGGTYSATRATLEGCWIRPRYRGYLGFQAKGGDLVEQHLRGNLGEAALLEALSQAFAKSGAS